MSRPPLSTPLSHVLVAFTIELDNEFERRFAEAGVGRRFGVSLVMWSNFLRFVGDGIAVGELPEVAGLPKPRVLSTLGGMERWRYVFVAPEPAERPPESKRDGYGSARGLRHDWLVRPTEAGRVARELWPSLLDEIEGRWRERFGTDAIRELRASLEAVVGRLDVELPEYLPIVAGATGMVAEITEQPAREGAQEAHLPALLARVLLAYTLDFELESDVSLPLSANVLRVLADEGLDLRELPLRAGISKEGTSMALRFLTKHGYLEVQGKLVQLTPKGREAEQAARRRHAEVERVWEKRFGADGVRRLRDALGAVLAQRPQLSLGLQPYPEGWRATKPYLEQTKAVIDDPLGRLPAYPLVLPRGGWPDGS